MNTVPRLLLWTVVISLMFPKVHAATISGTESSNPAVYNEICEEIVLDNYHVPAPIDACFLTGQRIILRAGTRFEVGSTVRLDIEPTLDDYQEVVLTGTEAVNPANHVHKCKVIACENYVVPAGHVATIHSDIAIKLRPGTRFEYGSTVHLKVEPVPNQTPNIAIASVADQYPNVTVVLDGSATTDDGIVDPLTFTWTQLAGPSANIVSPQAATTDVDLTSSGTYTFLLEAFDGQLTGSAMVDVVVVDPPTIAFGAAGAAYAEAGGRVAVPLTVTAGAILPGASAEVSVSAIAGGASVPGDAEVASADATLTLTDDPQTWVAWLTLVDDAGYEFDEALTLGLDATTFGSIGAQASHTVTIQDDDTITVDLAQASSSAAESAGDVPVVVRLSQPLPAGWTGTLQVPFTVLTGGANDAGPGDASVTSPLDIPAGSTLTDHPIAVSLTDDTEPEATEQIRLQLEALVTDLPRVVLASPAPVHALDITDDDAFVLSVTATPVAIAEEGTTSASFDVTLSHLPVVGSPITVPITWSDSSDFTAVPDASVTELVFDDETVHTIQVTAIDDPDNEGPESHTLTLGTATGFPRVDQSGNQVATVEVSDNDNQAPTALISPLTGGDVLTATGECYLGASIQLDASGSSDPDTGPEPSLNYTWSLVAQPVGSTLAIADPGLAQQTLTPDLVGDYTIELAVTDGADTVTTQYLLRVFAEPSFAFAAATGQVDEVTGQATTDALAAIAVSGTVLDLSGLAFGLALSVAGGTADAGDGGIAAGDEAISITYAAQSVSARYQVTDDTLFEQDETVILELALQPGSRGSVAGQTQHTLTIRDQDRLTLAFAETGLAPAEGAAGVDTSVGYQVTCTPALPAWVGADLTVGIAPQDPALITSGDASLTDTQALFSPGGSGTDSLALVVHGDDQPELDEVLTLLLGPTGGLDQSLLDRIDIDPTANQLTVTLVDDDAFLVSLSTGSVVVDEAGDATPVVVTVDIGYPAVDPDGDGTGLSLPFTLPDPGGDLTVSAASPLVFLPGEQAKDITLATDTTQGVLVEGDESFTLTPDVAAATGFPRVTAGTPGSTAITVLDQEVTIAFAAATSQATESEVTHVIPLTLSRALPAAVDLGVTVAGSADDGDRLLPPLPLALAAGATTASIDLQLLQDTAWEGDETVDLTLSGVTGSSLVFLGSDTTHLLTIQDDDRVEVGFAASSSTTNEGFGSHEILVTWDRTIPEALELTLSSDDTGNDLLLPANPVVIPAGTVPPYAVPVTVSQADGVEADEVVTVTLDAVSATTIDAITVSPTSHAVTIRDEGQADLRFADHGVTLKEGAGLYSVGLELSTAATTTTTIGLSLTHGTTSAADVQLVTSSVTFDPGESSAAASIYIEGDAMVEGDETAIIAVSDGAGHTLVTPVQFELMILDDDELTVAFASSGSQALEDNGSHQVTITASQVAPSDLTIGLSVRAGSSAQEGSDYAAISSPVILSAGASSATISVSILDDTTAEEAESLVLDIVSVQGPARLGVVTAHEIGIDDDDGADPLPAPAAPTFSHASGTHLGPIVLAAAVDPGYAEILYTIAHATLGQEPVEPADPTQAGTAWPAAGLQLPTASGQEVLVRAVARNPGATDYSGESRLRLTLVSGGDFTLPQEPTDGSALVVSASPLSVEGLVSTYGFDFADITLAGVDVSTGAPTGITAVRQIASRRYFGNVHLTESPDDLGARMTRIEVRSGGSTLESMVVEWQPVNIVDTQQISIRPGDSLLLEWDDGSQEAVVLNDGLGGTYQLEPGVPQLVTYDQGGLFTALVTTLEGATLGSIGIGVIDFSLPVEEQIAAEIGSTRTYKIEAAVASSFGTGLSYTDGAAPAAGHTLAFTGFDDELVVDLAGGLCGEGVISMTLDPQVLADGDDIFERPVHLVYRIGDANGPIIGAKEILDFEQVAGPDAMYGKALLAMRPLVDLGLFSTKNYAWKALDVDGRSYGVLDRSVSSTVSGTVALPRDTLKQRLPLLGGATTAEEVTVSAVGDLTTTHYIITASTTGGTNQILKVTADTDADGVKLYEPCSFTWNWSIDPMPTSDASIWDRLHVETPDGRQRLDAVPTSTSWNVRFRWTSGIDYYRSYTAEGDPFVENTLFMRMEYGQWLTAKIQQQSYYSLSADARLDVVDGGFSGLEIGAVTVDSYADDGYDYPATEVVVAQGDHQVKLKGLGVGAWDPASVDPTIADIMLINQLWTEGRHPYPLISYGYYKVFTSTTLDVRVDTYLTLEVESYFQDEYQYEEYGYLKAKALLIAQGTTFGADGEAVYQGTIASQTITAERAHQRMGFVYDSSDIFAAGALTGSLETDVDQLINIDYESSDAVRSTAGIGIAFGKDGRSAIKLSGAGILGGETTLDYQRYRPGCGGADGVAAVHPLWGGYLAVDVSSGNLVATIPVTADHSALPKPELYLTYNSLDATDFGFGPGWRSNFDLMYTGGFLIDETGRRVPVAGPVHGPAYLTELNQQVDEQGNPLASGDFLAGEATRLARRDNRVLYFDQRGLLTRIVGLDGQGIVVERQADDGATALIDESLFIAAVYYLKDATGVPPGAASVPAGDKLDYGTLLTNMPTDLDAPASGTWSFTYYDLDQDYGSASDPTLQSLKTITLAGSDAHGHFAFEDDIDSQTVTVTYTPADAATGRLPTVDTVDYDGDFSASVDYTYASASSSTITSAVVTAADHAVTTYNSLNTTRWTSLTGPDGITRRRLFTAGSWKQWLETAEATPVAYAEQVYELDDATGLIEAVTVTVDAGVTHRSTYAWSDLKADNPALFGAAVLTERVDHSVAGTGAVEDLVTRFRYASSGAQAGRLIRMVDPNGSEVAISYDANGLPDQLVDPRGKIWRQGFDQQGRPTGSTSPAGRGGILSDYDAELALPRQVEDRALGYTGKVGYDGAARITSITRPGYTASSTITYDPLGRITGVRDEAGRGYDHEYDRLGRLRSRSVVLGTAHPLAGTTAPAPDISPETWNWTYDATAQRWTVVHARSTRQYVTEIYDLAGRLRERRVKRTLVAGASPTDCSTIYGLDPATGRLQTITDPEGATIAFTYDDLGRVLTRTETKSDNRTLTRTWEYNALGWLLSVTVDPNGEQLTTSFLYDRNGRRLRVRNPAGGWIRKSYDEAGNPIAWRPSVGKGMGVELDADGEPLVSTDQRGARARSSLGESDGSVTQRTWLEGTAVIQETTFGATRFEPTAFITRSDGAIAETVEPDIAPDGTLLSLTPSNATKVEFGTDAAGRRYASSYQLLIGGAVTTFRSEVAFQDGTGVPLLRRDTLSGLAVRYEPDAVTGEVHLIADNRRDTDDAIEDFLVTERILSRNKRGQVLGSGRYASEVAIDVDPLPAPELPTDRTYHADGSLHTVTGPDGITTTYTYDLQGRLESVQRGTAAASQYRYDRLGNVVRYQSPSGSVLTREFDNLGRILWQDIDGDRTEYQYDPDTRDMVEVVGPDGGTTRFETDTFGLRSSVTNADGESVHYIRDDHLRTRRIEMRNADGSVGETVAAFTFDPADIDRVTTVTDGTGRVSTLAYDPTTGEYTGRTLSDGTTITVQRRLASAADKAAVSGSVVVATTTLKPGNGDPDSVVSRYFGRDNRLRGLEVPQDYLVTFSYDAAGRRDLRLRHVWDASANGGAGGMVVADQLAYRYYAAGDGGLLGRLREIGMSDGDGNPITDLTATLTYGSSGNAAGQLVGVALPNGVSRGFDGHDAEGRPTTASQTMTNADPAWTDEQWTLQRDERGRVTSVQGPDGTVTYRYHDTRLVEERRTDPRPLYRVYGYTPGGDRTSVVDFFETVAVTRSTEDPIDGFNELPSSLDLDQTAVIQGQTLDFDADGNTGTSALTWDGQLTNRLELTLALATPGTDPMGAGFRFAIPGGEVLQALWQVRPTTATDFGSEATDARLVVQRVDAMGTVLAELGATAWENRANLEVILQLVLTGSDAFQLTAGGHRLELRHPNVPAHLDATTSRQLVLVSVDPAASAVVSAVAYDTAQERREQYGSFDFRHRLQTLSDITTTLIDDGQGGLSNQKTAHLNYDYDYDAGGQLLAVKEQDELADGPSGPWTTVRSYGYDILDRLIASTVAGQGASYEYVADTVMRSASTQGGATMHFQWDGSDVIADSFDGSAWRAYAHHGSQPLWRHGLTATSQATATFGIDPLGNVTGEIVDIADTATDIFGLAYQYRYVYDAWGQRTVETADTSGSSLGYTSGSPRSGFGYRGQYHDGGSGLIYLRNRYYDPRLAGFITEDPARAGDNWYAYAGGDPVNRWDPSGLWAISADRSFAIAEPGDTLQTLYDQLGGELAVGRTFRDFSLMVGVVNSDSPGILEEGRAFDVGTAVELEAPGGISALNRGSDLLWAVSDLQVQFNEAFSLHLNRFEVNGILGTEPNILFRAPNNVPDSVVDRLRGNYPEVLPEGAIRRLAASDVNHLNAQRILSVRGSTALSDYIGSSYRLARGLNPIHFTSEVGFSIGSGEEPVLGGDIDRADAVAHLALYLAFVRGGEFLGAQLNRLKHMGQGASEAVYLRLVDEALGGQATVGGRVPNVVARGDTRAPAEIFKSGFKPKGSSTDLQAYAAENIPSIYVGTSRSATVAEGFAGQGGYVYIVRARLGVDVNARLGASSPFKHEAEIALPGGAPGVDIVGAFRVGPNGIQGPFIPNPRFSPGAAP